MELERERCHHRPLAFDKMEGLVREMQDPVTGVPVGCQKLFLTSIPSVFLGYDLIEWLMERLGIEESEALNLANQLCQYGYFFPVSDSKNLVVKDDSSLYRFQSPYFWPCQTRTPDNVEYAIYLAKRTLRNKQRHGLDEYEVEALNNLKKNLANKWDFITMQAEEQVRLAKERKKGEKLISDSQERAYWRVYRPPPGMTSSLEPCPIPNRSRNGNKPRKRTLDDYRREVEFLRKSLSRTRIKVSTALESMVHYVETYTEYDPILSGIQPSNPWISEDTAYWQLNGDLVDVPTEKRVRRWALSIEELVSDPTGLQEFTNYLRKEYSHENIRFWLAVNDLRHSAQSQIQRKVAEIFEEFLAPGAPCEINIDGKTMEKVHQELANPSRFTFDAAAEHVYTLLLKKDCYPRFIRSEHYKNLLAAGVQPLHKKRFFGFVGPTKKKQSTTVIQNQNLLHQSGVATSSSAAQSSSAGMNTINTGGGILSRRRGSDRSLSGSAHELAVCGINKDVVSSRTVSHSHSQSNLSEIPYRGDLPTPFKGTFKLWSSPDSSSATAGNVGTSGGDSQNVCPWDAVEPANEPSFDQETHSQQKSSNAATVASTSESFYHYESTSATTGTRSRKNSTQFDSGSSSSDISSNMATDSLDRVKRSSGFLTQQNTIEGGEYYRNMRKLSTVSCIETIRRSSVASTMIATSTKALPARPSVSSFEDIAPQRSTSSVTSPCNVTISDNSDLSINKDDNVQKDDNVTNVKKSLNNLRKTNSVTSGSVAPIISVSSVMDDNKTTDIREIEGTTKRSIEHDAVDETIKEEASSSNEAQDILEISTPTPSSETDMATLEQTIDDNVKERKDIIPQETVETQNNVIREKGDVHLETTELKEQLEEKVNSPDEQETAVESEAIALPKILTFAPLAEPDGGSPLSDVPPEEIEEEIKDSIKNQDENKAQTPQSADDKKAEKKKNSDVCPWEDEESCKVDTPFVKTYATLGYL